MTEAAAILAALKRLERKVDALALGHPRPAPADHRRLHHARLGYPLPGGPRADHANEEKECNR